MASKVVQERIARFLCPVYDEVTLFLHSVVMLLFLAFNSGPIFRSIRVLLEDGPAEDIAKSAAAVALAAFVVALPIRHAFSKRRKREWEKGLMLLTVTVTSFVVAWNAYDQLAAGSAWWKLVVPFLNALQPTIALLAWRKRRPMPGRVADENAPLAEVLVGGAAVIAVFVVFHCAIGAHWAITFSSSVFYATTLNWLVARAVRAARRRPEAGRPS